MIQHLKSLFVYNLTALILNGYYYVYQSERAARKATILQMATMYTVCGGTLLNLGVTFTGQGSQIIANGSFIGAGDPSDANISQLKPKFIFIKVLLADSLKFIKMQEFSLHYF